MRVDESERKDCEETIWEKIISAKRRRKIMKYFKY
jgi:hypothetical protein